MSSKKYLPGPKSCREFRERGPCPVSLVVALSARFWIYFYHPFHEETFSVPFFSFHRWWPFCILREPALIMKLYLPIFLSSKDIFLLAPTNRSMMEIVFHVFYACSITASSRLRGIVEWLCARLLGLNVRCNQWRYSNLYEAKMFERLTRSDPILASPKCEVQDSGKLIQSLKERGL